MKRRISREVRSKLIVFHNFQLKAQR